jgi:anti-sigma factor (TIGR02949 family)
MNDPSHAHKCDHLIATISEYVDGSLSPQLCAELEKHLRECENCTVVVDTLRKTISLVQTCAEDDCLPGEVRARLFHTLDLDDFVKNDAKV